MNDEKFEIGAKNEKLGREIQIHRGEKEEVESSLALEERALLEKLQVVTSLSFLA